MSLFSITCLINADSTKIWISIGPRNSPSCSMQTWKARLLMQSDVQRPPPSPQHIQSLGLLSQSPTEPRWKISFQKMADRLITCRAFICRRKVIATTKRLKKEEMYSGDVLNEQKQTASSPFCWFAPRQHWRARCERTPSPSCPQKHTPVSYELHQVGEGFMRNFIFLTLND